MIFNTASFHCFCFLLFLPVPLSFVLWGEGVLQERRVGVAKVGSEGAIGKVSGAMSGIEKKLTR